MKISPNQSHSVPCQRLLLTPIISAFALMPIISSNAGVVLIPAAGNDSGAGSSAFIVGGTNNKSLGSSSVILGGSGNTATNSSMVLGGIVNVSSGDNSVIVSGRNNSLLATRGAILGGIGNSIGSLSTSSSIAGGVDNSIAKLNENASSCFIGGGNGNSVIGTYGSVVAGDSNIAAGNSAFVGGGKDNASTGSYAATGAGRLNTASGSHSFVGGGVNSIASAIYSTVGGGDFNSAMSAGSTISGGLDNVASGNYATVSGGRENTSSGTESAVVGGVANTASGNQSTVLGGRGNTASGESSVAGGDGAFTSGQTSFVWGNSITTSGTGSVTLADNDRGNLRARIPFTLADNSRFNGIFEDGYYLYTTSHPVNNPLVGARLRGGSTAWEALSNRDSKTDFETVDTVAVLEKVAAMPMTTWKYKHDSKTRYMGVMAQDLFDAFELGQSDKTINTLVADGVQIAAIQGLNQKLEQKVKEIEGLKQKQATLEAKMERLEKLLEPDF